MKIKVLHRGYYNRRHDNVALLAEGEELTVVGTIPHKSGDYYHCEREGGDVDVEVENAEIVKGTK